MVVMTAASGCRPTLNILKGPVGLVHCPGSRGEMLRVCDASPEIVVLCLEMPGV